MSLDSTSQRGTIALGFEGSIKEERLAGIVPGRRFMIITSRGNWQKLSRRHEWVFSSPGRAQSVASGDEAVVYLTGQGRHPPSLVGVIRFKGPVEEAPEEPFYLVFKHRAPIEVLVVADEPVPFENVRSELGFVPSDRNYGQVLQGREMLEVDGTDFRTMSKAVDAAGAKARKGRGLIGER